MPKINIASFSGINRILVIKLKHIGDTLLTVPAFGALRNKFPEAFIVALVNKGTEDVLIGNPLIDEVVGFDRSIKKLPFLKMCLKELQFVMKMRGRKFDMVIDMTPNNRGDMMSIATGAKYRISFANRRRLLFIKYFLTNIVHRNCLDHMVLQNLSLLRGIGIEGKNLDINFYVPDEAKSFVRNIFERNGISSRDALVHVHPTSRWLFKCWGDQYMAGVISWLLKNNIKVILTSSPDMIEIKKTKILVDIVLKDIKNFSSNLISLCGKTDLKQLAAISQASDLFFGVDSAPMHIAAAVGTPVVALFGPTGIYN